MELHDTGILWVLGNETKSAATGFKHIYVMSRSDCDMHDIAWIGVCQSPMTSDRVHCPRTSPS